MAPNKNGKNPSKDKNGKNGKNGHHPASSGFLTCIQRSCGFLFLVVALVVGLVASGKFDMLNSISSNSEMSPNTLAAFATLFCISPLPGKMMQNKTASWNESHNFEEHGSIEDEDYEVASIYSIFYTIYKTTELTSPFGIKYMFTFNTWGFLATPVAEKAQHGGVLGDLSKSSDASSLAHYDFQALFPERDPERFGKHAYASLVTQKSALEYMRQNNVGLGDGTHFERNAGGTGPAPVEIVEVGCGTGAGANLISRHIVKNSNYLALDMQKAAINTCQERHEGRGKQFIEELAVKESQVSTAGIHPAVALIGTPALEELEARFPVDNPSLRCRLVPNGVGHPNDDKVSELNEVPRATSSVDMVIVSETHIADVTIGALEKAIFKEVRRVLKPGGLFLWGNAIPTKVWHEAAAFLPELGFELVDSTNHTQEAVEARDLDKERVDMAIGQMLDPYTLFKIPHFGPQCYHVVERLVANFYRHPGTSLYINMVTGFDSYMQQAWRLKK